MDHDARRVLLCMRYGIGDVVMELPVLESLRRALPQAHITALAASPATQLLERHPDLDALVSLNDWGIRHRWDRGPGGVERALSAWLDRADFDLFLDVHHVTPVVGEVVWSRGVRSLEADEAVERGAVRRGESGVAAIRQAVRAGWGLEVPPTVIPRIECQPEDEAFADEFLRRSGMEGGAPLAISPVASLSLKRWPIDRLARIADEMVERTGQPLLAFCGPQERAGQALRQHMRHSRRLVCVGPLHLLRVAALLERCRAFVCNDTGLLHIAGACGTPTLGIFGPTAPSIYRPPGESVMSVGGEEVVCPHLNTGSLHPPACFPAGRCLVREQGCIEQTSLDEVRDALHSLLQEAEQAARPTPSVA